MIIESQDKDGIINFDNVITIRLSIDFETKKRTIIYVDTVGDEHFSIAEYKTEERAKEVLQDIIGFYIRTEEKIKFIECQRSDNKWLNF